MEGEIQQQYEEQPPPAMQHSEVVVPLVDPPLTSQPPPPYHSPPLALPCTIAPFGFTVQPFPPHFQLARHPHLTHQVYHLSPPAFQYPPHTANSQPTYASLSQPPPGLQYYGVRSLSTVPHHVFPIATGPSMQPTTIPQVN